MLWDLEDSRRLDSSSDSSNDMQVDRTTLFSIGLINTAQGSYQYHEMLRLMKINNPRKDKSLEQLSFRLARFFDAFSQFQASILL